MRQAGRYLLIAVVLLTTISATVHAGHWKDREPRRAMNYVGRCLGIGWSDGYHAVGSRNSWSPPRGKLTRYTAQPSPWQHGVMAPPHEEYLPPTAAPELRIPTPAQLPPPIPMPIPNGN